MGKCKIIGVQKAGKNIPSPLIVGWDHGTLKDEIASSSICDIQRNSTDGRLKSVEVKFGNDVVYEGNIKKKPLCQTFIAVRSKNKKRPSHSKVRLFQVSNVLLTEKKLIQERKSENFELDHSKFYKIFGSKRVLLSHQTKEKMNLVHGTEIRDDLKEQLGMVKIEKEEGESNHLDDSISILPRCNRTAEKIDEVYNVESIIPQDIMLELEDDAEHVLNYLKQGNILDSEEYTLFFKESISLSMKPSFAKVKVEPNVLKERVKMLVFCELLLKLINSKRAVESKKFILISKLPLTNQYILDNYLSQSGGTRQLTLQNQDKVICHVMILSLLACSYILNFKSLCSSVPYSSEKYRAMLNIVGVTPVPNTDKNVYTLKTPLPPLPTYSSSERRGVKRKR